MSFFDEAKDFFSSPIVSAADVLKSASDWGTNALDNIMTELDPTNIFGDMVTKGMGGLTQQGPTPVVSIPPQYMVKIICPDLGINIQAWLPESVSLDINSDWNAPFAEGLISDKRLTQAAAVIGAPTTTQMMTTQFWQGSAPWEFTLPLVLTLERSGLTDITLPLLQLKRLTMPTKTGGALGLLKPPGPHVGFNPDTALGAKLNGIGNDLAGGKTEDVKTHMAQLATDLGEEGVIGAVSKLAESIVFRNKTTLYIGSFMKMPSVVLTHISEEYEMLFDEYNIPIKCKVNVSFRTHQTPTFDELGEIFNGTAEVRQFVDKLSKAGG